jgi:hypothetical protein
MLLEGSTVWGAMADDSAHPDLPELLSATDFFRDAGDEALSTLSAAGKKHELNVPRYSVRELEMGVEWHILPALELVGAYAAGHQPDLDHGNGTSARSDFDVAFDIAARAPLDGVVGAVYPLERWREALDHAFGAGATSYPVGSRCHDLIPPARRSKGEHATRHPRGVNLRPPCQVVQGGTA